MKLADYLKSKDITATTLAAEVGVSVSTITRAANGDIIPSQKLMGDIFEKTGGAVTPNDFYGLAA